MPAALAHAGAAADAGGNFILRNVHVVDTVDGSIARGRAIVVRNGTITAIRPNDEVDPEEDGQSIDGRGGYAIPGLWDSHVHILQGSGEQARADARMLLAHGITHVRDMGSSLEAVTAFRAGGTDEEQSLHLLAAGPTFWTFELPYGNPTQKQLVKSADEIDAAVDRLAAAGVDLIKPYAGFDAAMLTALAEAAQRKRLRVGGHAQAGLTLEAHARLGMSSVEHFEFNTFQECAADADAYFQRVIAARFRNSGESIPAIHAAFANAVDTPTCRAAIHRAGIAGAGRFAIVPTLHISFLTDETARGALAGLSSDRREACDLYIRQFGSDRRRDTEQLRKAARQLMGLVKGSAVTILAGTDAPAFCASPGPALSEELALLHDAGLSPLETLQAATLAPARHAGFADEFGRIAAGRPADIVLLAENPLKSLAAYRRPTGVLTRGRWWSRERVEALRSSGPR